MSNESTAITIYQAIAPVETPIIDILPSLEQVIEEWVENRYKNGQSEKTKQAYKETVNEFRHHLQRLGLDLDNAPRLVAEQAEAWADSSKRPGHQVTWTTFNQRLAILSSCFTYGIKKEAFQSNPIERIERRKRGKKDAARPLSANQVKAGLAKIDRATVEGMRDYALLSIALTTGHRASELAGLRMKHLRFDGNSCLIQWERCKGNEEMNSTLKANATHALATYLQHVYGAELFKAPPDAPVWISFSKRNAGQAIGRQTISKMCDDYFGTSKVHTTRHTAAMGLLKKGANLAEIGRFLGHKNLKTTSDYLEELTGYDNPYGDELEAAFGIE